MNTGNVKMLSIFLKGVACILFHSVITVTNAANVKSPYDAIPTHTALRRYSKNLSGSNIGTNMNVKIFTAHMISDIKNAGQTDINMS